MSQAPRSRMACSATRALWAGGCPDDDVAFLQGWDETGARDVDRAVHRRVDDPQPSGGHWRSPATKGGSSVTKGPWVKGVAFSAVHAPGSSLLLVPVCRWKTQSLCGSRSASWAVVQPSTPRAPGARGAIAFVGLKVFSKAQAVADQPAQQRGGSAFTPLAAWSPSGMLMSSFSATRRKMKLPVRVRACCVASRRAL